MRVPPPPRPSTQVGARGGRKKESEMIQVEPKHIGMSPEYGPQGRIGVYCRYDVVDFDDDGNLLSTGMQLMHCVAENSSNGATLLAPLHEHLPLLPSHKESPWPSQSKETFSSD